MVDVMGEENFGVGVTLEQYLEQEVHSPYKHEFVDGEVFAMAGGSANHSLIATNIITALNIALDGCPDHICRVYNSDMRLGVPAAALYTYPDVQVVCGDPEFGPHETLLNPQLIVEVLSESTKNFDLGGKFEAYRSMRSLKEYLAIYQDRRRVVRHVALPDASWQVIEHAEGDFPIRIACGIRLSFDAIYRNVSLNA